MIDAVLASLSPSLHKSVATHGADVRPGCGILTQEDPEGGVMYARVADDSYAIVYTMTFDGGTPAWMVGQAIESSLSTGTN